MPWTSMSLSYITYSEVWWNLLSRNEESSVLGSILICLKQLYNKEDRNPALRILEFLVLTLIMV